MTSDGCRRNTSPSPARSPTRPTTSPFKCCSSGRLQAPPPRQPSTVALTHKKYIKQERGPRPRHMLNHLHLPNEGMRMSTGGRVRETKKKIGRSNFTQLLEVKKRMGAHPGGNVGLGQICLSGPRGSGRKNRTSHTQAT